MTEKFYHPDDQWTPINKPDDPCQMPNCQCKKHQFPFHFMREDGLPTGTLSRWCTKHTIEKGLCIRCSLLEIWHKDVGMCRSCERIVNAKLKSFNMSARDWTREMLKLSEETPSPYLININ